jgi:hypothetical protein
MAVASRRVGETDELSHDRNRLRLGQLACAWAVGRGRAECGCFRARCFELSQLGDASASPIRDSGAEIERFAEEARKDLTSAEGLWLSELDLSQWIDKTFAKLVDELPPRRPSGVETFGFDILGAKYLSVLPREDSPSSSVRAQYERYALRFREVARVVERILQLALPDENIVFGFMEFRRESDYYAHDSHERHRDSYDNEYITATIALFGFDAPSQPEASGAEALPAPTDLAGTTYWKLDGTQVTARTGVLLLNSAVPREKFFGQSRRSGEHKATRLYDRGTLVIGYRRKGFS